MNIPSFNTLWASMQRRHLQEQHDLFVQYGISSNVGVASLTGGTRAGGKGTLGAAVVAGALAPRTRRRTRKRRTAARAAITG
jgi:hypothetical protein